ncbi:hypothetical protein GTW25_11065 [Aliihoeflea aestuarii]|jgi:hypothetical protein|uniref:hypothetical protein n=1 Tax=Aliihoeflea aestuarii TaxID=453840 RepID=UPI002092508C|nr:hypothetical protein [Aliihoeflea aestuarii]MCO6391570.1 hypothetical protein [Aliihoeflea aestuarii]
MTSKFTLQVHGDLDRDVLVFDEAGVTFMHGEIEKSEAQALDAGLAGIFSAVSPDRSIPYRYDDPEYIISRMHLAMSKAAP